MPLPSSGNRGPVKPVALEFSADLFRGNVREKDLESISLDVIDEAHATRKLFFRGFVVLGVLDCGQTLVKSADVGRIVGEGVIGEADSASVILAEESCNRQDALEQISFQASTASQENLPSVSCRNRAEGT